MKIEINLISPSFQAAYLAATMMSIKTGEGVIFLTTKDGDSRFMLSGCYNRLMIESLEFREKIRFATEIL
jgi:hypothetical protein